MTLFFVGVAFVFVGVVFFCWCRFFLIGLAHFLLACPFCCLLAWPFFLAWPFVLLAWPFFVGQVFCLLAGPFVFVGAPCPATAPCRHRHHSGSPSKGLRVTPSLHPPYFVLALTFSLLLQPIIKAAVAILAQGSFSSHHVHIRFNCG